MPYSLRFPALITACLVLGSASPIRAQTNAPASGSPATPATEPAKVVVTDSGSTSAPSKHPRVMSDSVAGALANGMPKYNPPPKLPEPKPEDEQVDLREVDKPKNKIIRLPTYVVKQAKPPVFRDRDVHSKSERTDMALRRYAGLRIGNFGGLNNPLALFMSEEQDRLSDISELKNDAKDAKRSGDATAADYILKQTDKTYYRPSDFGWNSDIPGK